MSNVNGRAECERKLEALRKAADVCERFLDRESDNAARMGLTRVAALFREERDRLDAAIESSR